ncbi:MAG: hypothetical protein ACK4VI_07850 [Alphaproteobacteria bacterium]
MIDVSTIAQGLENDKDPFQTLCRFIYPMILCDTHAQIAADAMNTVLNGDYIIAGEMPGGNGFEYMNAEALDLAPDASMDIGFGIDAAPALIIPILPF